MGLGRCWSRLPIYMEKFSLDCHFGAISLMKGRGICSERGHIMAVTKMDIQSGEMVIPAEQVTVDNPVFHFGMNGSSVVLSFSEDESVGLKDEIRDILTAAYEDRIQNDFGSKMRSE